MNGSLGRQSLGHTVLLLQNLSLLCLLVANVPGHANFSCALWYMDICIYWKHTIEHWNFHTFNLVHNRPYVYSMTQTWLKTPWKLESRKLEPKVFQQVVRLLSMSLAWRCPKELIYPNNPTGGFDIRVYKSIPGQIDWQIETGCSLEFGRFLAFFLETRW